MLLALPLSKNVMSPLVRAFALFVTVNLAGITSVNAKNDELMQVGEWQVQLAFGLGQRDAIIAGQDDFDFYLAPNVSYYGEQLFFDNGTLGYTLTQQSDWVLSAALELNPMAKYFDSSHLGNVFLPLAEGAMDVPDYEFDAIDNVPLTGNERDDIDSQEVDQGEYPVVQQPQNGGVDEAIASRRWSVDAGLQFNYFLSERQQIYVKLMRDVSGLHQGWRALANWSLALPSDLPLGLTGHISAGLHWLDDNNGNYYFGHESSFAQRTYLQGGGLIPSLSLILRKPLTPHLSVVAHYQYQTLPTAIKNSPFVINNDIVTQFLGLNYAF